MKIIIYSKNFCPYCDMAKALMDANCISYEEINVQAPGETRSIPEHSTMKTFPQIFIGQKLVGGYDQLLQIHQQHGLVDGLKQLAESTGE